MIVESVYSKILSEIKLGHRGFVKLSQDDLEELNSLLLSHDEKELEKVMCIIEHSITLNLKFEKNLLHVLNSDVSGILLVFGLNCARRHIVEARFQRGQRLEYDFLETLKKLLFHKDPEVVEWTLRLIEGCGNQGVYFLNSFDKIKPPPWKWFNAHQRAVTEIITLLERRWNPHEKS